MKTGKNILLAMALLSLFGVTIRAVNFDYQQKSFLTDEDSFFVNGQYQSNFAVADKKNWILGVWEGTGYQVDTDTKWTIKFTAQKDKYTIEYPSLNCGGEWKAIKIGKKKAIFRETLAFGQDKCADGGQAIIEKISATQISFKFIDVGSPDVNSTAVLNRAQMTE